MTTAIVDYGSGNLRSAQKAFQRAAAELGLTEPILITADPETVAAADRIV
ncbi:MAG: imidazole glycerol phosphate synthase subunit HisH, partial [Pseudomonadota bacterium]